MSLDSDSDREHELNPLCNDAIKTHLGHFTLTKEPLRVLICGGAGQVAYSLLHPLITGQIFGSDQNLIVHLLDNEAMLPALQSLSMEMMNCCSTLLKGILKTFDLKVAFTDVDFVIMLASMPTKNVQSCNESLKSMMRLSREYGQAIDSYAKKTVKVLVVSDPCHLVATIMSRHASSIPLLNFSFLMRLDLNRTTGHISRKAGLSNRCVRKLIVWGESGQYAVVDSEHCELLVHGQWERASSVLNDEGCISRNLTKVIAERTASIQAMRPPACALSTASAICDHLRDWFFGTKLDHWTCMGVVSDGSYGVEPGIFYGFPTAIDANNGSYQIVEGLSLEPGVLMDLRKISSVMVAQRDDVIAIDNAFLASALPI